MITRRRLGEILAAIAIGTVQPAGAQSLAPRAGEAHSGPAPAPNRCCSFATGKSLDRATGTRTADPTYRCVAPRVQWRYRHCFPRQRRELACDLAAGAGAVTGSYSTVEISGSAPRFQMPAFIFATKASHHSNRPLETISPLLAAFKVPLDADHSDDDYAKVARDILSKPKYREAIVLVCWHHGKIPDLARALGATNPPPWRGTVFDRVWQLDYSGSASALSNLPQQLLYGDFNT